MVLIEPISWAEASTIEKIHTGTNFRALEISRNLFWNCKTTYITINTDLFDPILMGLIFHRPDNWKFLCSRLDTDTVDDEISCYRNDCVGRILANTQNKVNCQTQYLWKSQQFSVSLKLLWEKLLSCIPNI